jgi:hypothetical protein
MVAALGPAALSFVYAALPTDTIGLRSHEPTRPGAAPIDGKGGRAIPQTQTELLRRMTKRNLDNTAAVAPALNHAGVTQRGGELWSIAELNPLTDRALGTRIAHLSARKQAPIPFTVFSEPRWPPAA